MNISEFYIECFSIVESACDLDLSFIPSMLKRRLSPLNRVTFYTLNQCYDDSVDSIIYSSQYGEIDKLFKIVQQYLSENEVSPALFVSSVHNSSIGQYSILKNFNKPYQAVSATENTISMGLLDAITNNGYNSLFCYSESVSENVQRSVAVKISNNSDINKNKYRIIFNNIESEDNYSEWEILKSFLNNEKQELSFKNYRIERINI